MRWNHTLNRLEFQNVVGASWVAPVTNGASSLQLGSTGVSGYVLSVAGGTQDIYIGDNSNNGYRLYRAGSGVMHFYGNQAPFTGFAFDTGSKTNALAIADGGGVSIGSATDPGANNLLVSGKIKFGTNATGAGSALLGSNSPATTNSAPYTWVTSISSDGSTVYIPAWK
jgi:hypothetical protein